MIAGELDIARLSSKPHLIDACIAWDYAEWGCHMAASSLVKTRMLFEAALSDNELPVIWVATIDEAPAGMVSLVAHDHPDWKTLSPWLSALYVHPRFRKQGIAKALCETVIRHAFKLCADHLYLYTATSEKLYAALGWQAAGVVEGPTGLAETLMALSLRQA